ncbi:phosphoribosyltransferase [Streptomyces sp. NPDC059740]|uniref:phosphoribosyltransferase n=1 Tax=Streptomyces sp. NPDC059740 TaxID=3346926 RepID=UPI00365D6B9E
MRFTDRRQAGLYLAERLREPVNGEDRTDEAGVGWPESRTDPLVLALPRGGVPVAAEVARDMAAELDVLVARKIGAPGRPEVAVGAVAGEGEPLFDTGSLAYLGLTPQDMAGDVERERAEMRRREEAYRPGRPAPRIADRTVFLVDDGLATGMTSRAALQAVRSERPARIVLAVPVGAPDTVAALRPETDELVCLHTPHSFFAVGEWYDDFTQVSDEEVTRLLAGNA